MLKQYNNSNFIAVSPILLHFLRNITLNLKHDETYNSDLITCYGKNNPDFSTNNQENNLDYYTFIAIFIPDFYTSLICFTGKS